MSEQRFYITDTGLGLDTGSDEMYSFGNEEDFCRFFDKLNEQQATITHLEKVNEQLREKNKQIGYLKRDLFILINLIRDTPIEFNYDFEKIVERWE